MEQLLDCIAVENASNEELTELKENIDAEILKRETEFVVRGDGTRFAEVNEKARFTLYVPMGQESELDLEKPLAIQVSLNSLVDPEMSTTLQLAAVSNPAKRGVYEIEYIPKVRGRHHLLISVNGQPITGSPFSVFVKIHPTKLKKPVREVRFDNLPQYMAFNSSGQMIVAFSRAVMILNKEGELVYSINKSQYGFGTVCGVAIDKDDNIYITDTSKKFRCSSVYKFSKSGDTMLRRQMLENGLPRGIAVAGDRVFVCNAKLKVIQILTTDLKPVRQVGKDLLKQPVDIAVDSNQMLYVAVANSSYVKMSMDGQSVGSFGKRNGSCGVCANGDYVYVTESYHDGYVSVFTNDGRYITSFGKGCLGQTSTDGIVCTVCVDDDGFVYVFPGRDGYGVYGSEHTQKYIVVF